MRLGLGLGLGGWGVRYLVAVQPHLLDLRLRELAVVEHPA